LGITHLESRMLFISMRFKVLPFRFGMTRAELD
jgi:hypothetical protein